ncbi:hypothetical protein ACFQ3Z_04670 [Streptomyces nogalater]
MRGRGRRRGGSSGGGPSGTGLDDDLWRPGGLGDPALVQAVLSSAMPEAQRSRALYLLGLSLGGPLRAAAVVVAEPAALPEALRACAAGLLAPSTRAGGPAPQAALWPRVGVLLMPAAAPPGGPRCLAAWPSAWARRSPRSGCRSRGPRPGAPRGSRAWARPGRGWRTRRNWEPRPCWPTYPGTRRSRTRTWWRSPAWTPSRTGRSCWRPWRPSAAPDRCGRRPKSCVCTTVPSPTGWRGPNAPWASR